ncbi:MAG: M48 family metallopeptidase [Planctomycetota bacterium]
MGGLFYNLGKLAGPKIRKAKWAYLAATAPKDEVIEAESIVGDDMACAVRKQFECCRSLEKVDLLRSIGSALGRCLKNNRRRYSFECIHSVEPQAFCLPGGFIFVSDSLIDLCEQGADQIAFVLAHEMAHVIEGHVMERMLSHSLIKAVMRAGHLRAATTGSLGQVGIRFLERAYSQENELRADTMGVRLAVAAGYNPAAMIDLFLRLEPLQKDDLLSQYFSTHPSCQRRIENIRRLRRNTSDS